MIQPVHKYDRNAGAWSRKAKGNNLKEFSETVNYLTENEIFTLEELEARLSEDTYWATKHQKMLLYAQIGRGQESIDEVLAKVTSGSENPEEWICLIAAYRYHGEEEKAYEWFPKAVNKFPEKAVLYVYGGDACKNLGRYEEAFSNWNKALQIDHSLYDAKYSKGFCYEELGDYQKAYDIWCEIADELKTEGYEIEVKFPMELAENARKN